MNEISLAELRRHNLLRTLVKRQVIAETVAGQELDPATLEQARQQFLRRNGLDSAESLQAFLENNGLGQEDLEWQIALPLLIRAHCDEHFRHKAEAHFLKRKNQLDRVVYSLLRVQDQFLARELFLRIEAGEASFADLAGEYAEGPERQTRGIVGPVSLTQAHPALAERLRTSDPGVLLQPFPINEWWLVARLESYQPASFDEATAEQMTNELFKQWVRDETTRRIGALMASGVATVQE